MHSHIDQPERLRILFADPYQAHSKARIGAPEKSYMRLWASAYYETRQEARDDVIDYIEMLYNSTRMHSYLDYMSPNE